LKPNPKGSGLECKSRKKSKNRMVFRSSLGKYRHGAGKADVCGKTSFGLPYGQAGQGGKKEETKKNDRRFGCPGEQSELSGSWGRSGGKKGRRLFVVKPKRPGKHPRGTRGRERQKESEPGIPVPALYAAARVFQGTVPVKKTVVRRGTICLGFLGLSGRKGELSSNLMFPGP